MYFPQTTRARGLAALLTIAFALGAPAAARAARSPYETSTPLVVQPPTPKTSNEKPKTTDPGPTPQQAPEPASLLTAAVGSSLGLMAWLRSRRRRGDQSAAE